MADNQLQSQDNKINTEYPGLKNLGNTCFFNSVIQVLCYCPGIFGLLFAKQRNIKDYKDQKEDLSEDDKNKINFVLELITFIKKVHLSANKKQETDISKEFLKEEENDCLLVPQTLLDSLRLAFPLFEPGTQQDAHECFSCIINLVTEVESFLEKKCKVNSIHVKKQPIENKLRGGGGHKDILIINKENMEGNPEKSTAIAKPGNALKSFNALKQNKITQLKYSKILSPVHGNSKEVRETENTPSSGGGGCYERFKRRRFNMAASKSFEPNKKSGITSKSFYATSEKLSPPLKRKRTELLLNNNPWKSPSFKSRRMLTTSKFFSFKRTNLAKKFISSSIISSKPAPVTSQSTETQKSKPVLSNNVFDVSFGCENVNQLFSGELVSISKCLQCETAQNRAEVFMDISLPVKEAKSSCEDVEGQSIFDFTELNENSVEKCSLSWAFNQFTTEEILSGENKYFCTDCDRLNEASQHIKFKSLPSLLSIHLKRFTTQLVGGDMSCSIINKNNIAFQIPKVLSMKEWCIKSCKQRNADYKLFAIIVHRGSTMFSGHYLSYTCVNSKPNFANEEQIWIEADDSATKIISQQELDNVINSTATDGFLSQTPYMLFYHKLIEQ